MFLINEFQIKNTHDFIEERDGRLNLWE